MKRKIKNFLIRLNLFQTLKFIIGLFQVVRIKLLFPQLVFKSISLKYKIAFFSDETIIENLLRERNLYHPVSDYNFSAINAINKKSYAYVIQSNNENILIPFLHYYDNTGGGIIILINYLKIPEWAMLVATKEIIKYFWVKSISTQRNYNAYSLGFFKKNIFEDAYLALCENSYEQYFNELGKKTRFNIGYYNRKLKEQYGDDITTKVYKSGEFNLALFFKFVNLVGERYDKAYWQGFSKKNIFDKLKNNIIVITVTIDNKEVAYNIFYSHEDTLIFTGNTFDEKYKQYSLGFITTANSIKWAFENGYKKVILGPGDFGYKARLSNRQEVLYEYKL